jgi:hypothetical protein
MIDDPGSLSGIVSSPNPARGPLAYQRYVVSSSVVASSSARRLILPAELDAQRNALTSLTIASIAPDQRPETERKNLE